MLKLAYGSSNFSTSSIENCSPRPKRERKKRKVHFSSELDELSAESRTMSTSTFVRQRGMAWNRLAQVFDCEEDLRRDDVIMSELLNLCNFWAEKEPVFGGVHYQSDELDDSDDDGGDDLESFEQHITAISRSLNSRFSSPCSSLMCGVSSLRLKSVLCVSNQPSIHFDSSTSFIPGQTSPAESQSDADKLESAFKGVMDDNEENSRDCRTSSSRFSSVSDDFWSQVEF